MIDLSTDIQAAQETVAQPARRTLSPYGIQTSYKIEDDRIFVGRTSNMTRLAEYCKALHNEGFHGSSEMRLVAKFDPVLVEKYCNDKGITFQEFMHDETHVKRMAEDPNNAAFRVWKGRI